MRVPRRFVLGPGSAFHAFWRGHNREWVLKTPDEKRAYLKFFGRALGSSYGAVVQIFAFCLMSNHPHFTGRIEPEAAGVLPLSRIFQIANGVFGRWYNRLHGRSGKVAEERFRSLEISDDQSLQMVMLYGDANPVRAGIVAHPRDYPWSSYRYYAHGEPPPGGVTLTQPAWYRSLGRSARARQRAYRRLMDRYLRAEGLLRDPQFTRGFFIGSLAFVTQRSCALRDRMRSFRYGLRDARAP